MIVDIKNYDGYTFVIFSPKNLVKNELIRISSMAASAHCFEAMSLLSEEFSAFLNSLKPRKKYCVVVGQDSDGSPYVGYGEFHQRAFETVVEFPHG